MGEIRTRTSGKVTVQKVVGAPTVDQFIHTVEEFYRGNPTPYIVWDITEGSLGQLSPVDLQTLVSVVRPVAAVRAGGKTAVVAPQDFEFGMGRMLEVYGAINKIPFEFRVFRNLATAAEWLGLHNDPP